MKNTLQMAAIDDVVDGLMDDPNRARDIIQKLHTRLLRDAANVGEAQADANTKKKSWYFRETDEADDDLFDNMPV